MLQWVDVPSFNLDYAFSTFADSLTKSLDDEDKDVFVGKDQLNITEHLTCNKLYIVYRNRMFLNILCATTEYYWTSYVLQLNFTEHLICKDWTLLNILCNNYITEHSEYHLSNDWILLNSFCTTTEHYWTSCVEQLKLTEHLVFHKRTLCTSLKSCNIWRFSNIL